MSTNDITGDTIKTKPANQAYLDNFDRIFHKYIQTATNTQIDQDQDNIDALRSSTSGDHPSTNTPTYPK